MGFANRQTVTAKAPAKINLILRVGAPDESGYHPLLTVFQALDLWDEVSITPASADHLAVEGSIDVTGVPTDHTNIVWSAVDALARVRGHREPLSITITKTIPVAGGMAGGSADAAATLVALNELWDMGLTHEKLRDIGGTLGADVPFSLLGGLALGEGRGDLLTPLSRTQPLHVVVVTSSFPLSTPDVYRAVDELRGKTGGVPDGLTAGEMAGVTGDDLHALAAVIANDMQPATLHLAPQVQVTIDALVDAGALASLVSGSGPTVYGLCLDASHAEKVATQLEAKGLTARHTVSTARGAHLISSLSSPTADH